MEEKAEVVTAEDEMLWQEHEIRRVYPLEGMKVLAVFVDGNSRVYDMKPLCDSSPVFRALEDRELFCKVRAGNGGLVWNEEIDLDSEDVYYDGIPVETPFDALLDLDTAGRAWFLRRGAIQEAIESGKIQKGTEARMCGTQWIVDVNAMIREFGPVPMGPGDMERQEDADRFWCPGIKSVYPMKDRRIIASFRDGVSKVYDVSPLIERDSVFAPLKDDALFDSVHLKEHWLVSWTEDICLSGREIYLEGETVRTPFDAVIDVKTATEMWYLREGEIMEAIESGKIRKGFEASLLGRNWLVSLVAMTRVFGSEFGEEGEQEA
ncbi:MAG: DUF2442 domain-containing protein [Clostridia bacterium]|nr:DUF2442 domain-containing protein [Clostridia bacterium]